MMDDKQWVPDRAMVVTIGGASMIGLPEDVALHHPSEFIGGDTFLENGGHVKQGQSDEALWAQVGHAARRAGLSVATAASALSARATTRAANGGIPHFTLNAPMPAVRTPRPGPTRRD